MGSCHCWLLIAIDVFYVWSVVFPCCWLLVFFCQYSGPVVACWLGFVAGHSLLLVAIGVCGLLVVVVGCRPLLWFGLVDVH